MTLAQDHGWLAAARTEFLSRTLGGVTAVARLLDVSPSQPSRWRHGKEQPSPPVAQRLLDLDHVVARLMLLWDESLIEAWLTSPNGQLGGVTPIDVIRTRGARDLLDAIDAELQGAYA
ncbi:MAG: antitoxin Xre/MbcA/ParS toxin-binding domain-containing protein [Acidimicrobiales bacterium]